MTHLIGIAVLAIETYFRHRRSAGPAQQPPAESRHLDFSMAKENAQDGQAARLRSIGRGMDSLGPPRDEIEHCSCSCLGNKLCRCRSCQNTRGLCLRCPSWRPHCRAVAAALFVSAPACVMHSKSSRVLPVKPGPFLMALAFILITPIPWA